MVPFLEEDWHISTKIFNTSEPSNAFFLRCFPLGTTTQNQIKNPWFPSDYLLKRSRVHTQQLFRFCEGCWNDLFRDTAYPPEPTVAGSKIRRSPVEVMSLSHYLPRFLAPSQVVGNGISEPSNSIISNLPIPIPRNGAATRCALRIPTTCQLWND